MLCCVSPYQLILTLRYWLFYTLRYWLLLLYVETCILYLYILDVVQMWLATFGMVLNISCPSATVCFHFPLSANISRKPQYLLTHSWFQKLCVHTHTFVHNQVNHLTQYGFNIIKIRTYYFDRFPIQKAIITLGILKIRRKRNSLGDILLGESDGFFGKWRKLRPTKFRPII